MKKIQTIIGIALWAGTFFTAHYASTTMLLGMQIWAIMASVILTVGGLILITSDEN